MLRLNWKQTLVLSCASYLLFKWQTSMFQLLFVSILLLFYDVIYIQEFWLIIHCYINLEKFPYKKEWRNDVNNMSFKWYGKEKEKWERKVTYLGWNIGAPVWLHLFDPVCLIVNLQNLMYKGTNYIVRITSDREFIFMQIFWFYYDQNSRVMGTKQSVGEGFVIFWLAHDVKSHTPIRHSHHSK